jgi:peptide deformylase
MIITDEKILRTKCTDAQPEEIGAIIEQLERELNYSALQGQRGIGLAAIQINIPKNVAIVRVDNIYKTDLVNCKIQNAYDKQIFLDEGCLSFPGRMENTMRYNEIHIVDNLVPPYSFIATGLFAVVIQHELNHLSGILLPDIALPKPKQRVRPNDLCYCGSKIKYKRCHQLQEKYK